MTMNSNRWPSGDLPEHTYAVTAEAIVRYAGASGDFTPIHYDGDVLRAAGYDEFFAMGMLAAGHVATTLVKPLGESCVVDLHVRFLQPSFVGEQVTCTARVLELDETTGIARVELAATGTQHGRLVAGTATVRMDAACSENSQT